MKTISGKRITRFWVNEFSQKYPYRGQVLIQESPKPRYRNLMWNGDGQTFYGRSTPLDIKLSWINDTPVFEEVLTAKERLKRLKCPVGILPFLEPILEKEEVDYSDNGIRQLITCFVLGIMPRQVQTKGSLKFVPVRLEVLKAFKDYEESLTKKEKDCL